MPSRKVLEAVAGISIGNGKSYNGKSASPDTFTPEDAEVAMLQRDMRDNLDRLLLNTPFREGRIIEVTFTAAELTKTIAHNLSGEVAGMFPVDVVTSTANFPVFVRDDVESNDPIEAARALTHVKIRTNYACTAKIWVWR